MTENWVPVSYVTARWSCRRPHVLGLIRSGKLPAIDISADAPNSRRPTYRIALAAISEYETRRQVAPPAPRVARPRRLAPARFYP